MDAAIPAVSSRADVVCEPGSDPSGTAVCRNFRKKLLAMELLVELDEVEQDVAHRAARLYRFDRKKYQQLEKEGFNFEI